MSLKREFEGGALISDPSEILFLYIFPLSLDFPQDIPYNETSGL